MKNRFLLLGLSLLALPFAAFAADAAQDALPPEWRYDKAPEVKAPLRIVYPYAALAAGTEGKAKALLMIDEAGHVSGITAGEATAPEFALALAAGLEALEFKPAKRAGKPTATAVVFEYEFSAKKMPAELKALLRREAKEPATIASAAAVDGGLKPKTRNAPLFPVALAGKNLTGEAVVEILIDEKGRARLPRIISASEPAFGYAAVQAITTWEFAEPKVNGKPAVVRVRVPVHFGGAAGAKST